MELEHIKEDFGYCREVSPNQEKGFMLVAKPYSNITIEARKFGNKNFDWAQAVALVSPNVYHKLLFNLTIRIWIGKPIKSFNSEDKARKWLEEVLN